MLLVAHKCSFHDAYIVSLKKCGILVSSNTSRTECMIRSNNHLLDHCLSKFTLGKAEGSRLVSFAAYSRRRQLIDHYADSYSTELTHVQSSKAHTKLKKKWDSLDLPSHVASNSRGRYVCYQWNCATLVVYPFLFNLCSSYLC